MIVNQRAEPVAESVWSQQEEEEQVVFGLEDESLDFKDLRYFA